MLVKVHIQVQRGQSIRMKIDCLSDLHGHYPKLEGGDLLIVAGDLTAKDTVDEYLDFYEWLDDQEYRCKIIVAGNHDNELFKSEYDGRNDRFHPAIYLQDSGTEFEGLKIWGSPWTKRFEGMNPNCMAFTVGYDEKCIEEEYTKWGPRLINQPSLADKWDMIPEDTNILITHCPPYGILDGIKRNISGKTSWLGSISLRNVLLNYDRIAPLRLHVFGHIHECGGKTYDLIATKYVNASHVNEHYEPVNKPVRVEL